MMGIKESLTNEKLRTRFDNPFQLVNYAISLARSKVARGEELDSNPTEEILSTILDSRDIFSLEDEESEEENDEFI
jgi:hypothetical protein